MKLPIRSAPVAPAAMATAPDSLLPGRPAPEAGFAAPYEMLGACHDKVRRMLELLRRLGAHLAQHGPDAQAGQAARDVMRYFDLAAPLHHEDEERHVLPCLLAGPDPALAALAQRLQQDHRDMVPAWARLRAQLEALSQGRDEGLDWRDFAALYQRHLHDEDLLAYPGAQGLSSPEALAAMGRDMMRRRGLRQA